MTYTRHKVLASTSGTSTEVVWGSAANSSLVLPTSGSTNYAIEGFNDSLYLVCIEGLNVANTGTSGFITASVTGTVDLQDTGFVLTLVTEGSGYVQYNTNTYLGKFSKIDISRIYTRPFLVHCYELIL